MISTDKALKLKEYQSNHPTFCNHYLFKTFINKPEHKDLFKEAICNPTKENKESLDMAFKHHCFAVKFLSYLSKSLYFKAINFDKNIRKQNQRNLLILDSPLKSEDESLSLINQLSTDELETDAAVYFNSSNIEDHLSNEKLLQSIQSLTENQKEILSLSYVEQYTDTEIAKRKNKTQQAVSKTRKFALLKLQKKFA
ncbi:RNA polymerase sigma factor (sigma-70 family) [Bacillus aryabhattai]|uniref:RNA polymerase sigma factor (Sigma-70 family) n=1 Tax=Priestia aryabhattai TaxID=412384 RepID=A0A7W3NHR3_PRIAR|nr:MULTISPECIES: sigma-70 family RNA polymerase sigma factor [Priestia]MBA9043239.1 RNA polymerase sigma factor (sigma-70 family) [Priestia aryabhattai]MEB4889026.1 sigma-70 family RNA polymerase sigma factor [Priestia megaterium]